MSNNDQRTPPVRAEAAKRAQRLAEELRANLRKRKEKARSGPAEPESDQAEVAKVRDRD